MELREFWEILRRERQYFFFVMGFFWLAGLLVAFFYPRNFEAYLPVDVGRESMQKTEDFQYDGYYRILADEKTADLVTKWVLAQETRESLIEKIRIGSTEGAKLKIKAEKVTTNYLRVRLIYSQRRILEETAEELKNNLTDRLAKVEGKGEQASRLFFGRLIIGEKKIPGQMIGVITTLLGIFFGLVVAMVRNYLKGGNEKR